MGRNEALVCLVSCLAIALCSAVALSSWIGPAHAATLPLVNAHRGTYEGGPVENSMNGFRAAAKYAEILEVDLRESSDRQQFLMHDSTIDRTTRSTGAVKNMTSAQLRRRRLNDGQTIPTLSEYASFIRSSGEIALIELKVFPSPTGWNRLHNELWSVKDRVILYSATSNSWGAAARWRGWQASYFSGDTNPTLATLRAFGGKYVHGALQNYSAAGRAEMAKLGYRFIGFASAKVYYTKETNLGAWAVSTTHANTVRVA